APNCALIMPTAVLVSMYIAGSASNSFVRRPAALSAVAFSVVVCLQYQPLSAPNMYEVVNTRTTTKQSALKVEGRCLHLCSDAARCRQSSLPRCADMVQASPFVCQHFLARLRRACVRLQKRRY